MARAPALRSLWQMLEPLSPPLCRAQLWWVGLWGRGSPEVGAYLRASSGGGQHFPLAPLLCTQKWGWGSVITTRDICFPASIPGRDHIPVQQKGVGWGSPLGGEISAGRGVPGALHFGAQRVGLWAESGAAFRAEMLMRVITGRIQEVLAIPMVLPLCPLPQKICPCPNPSTLNGSLFGNRVFADVTLKTRSH